MCFLVTVYQGRCFSLIIFNDVLFFFGFWFFAAICKLNVFSFRFLGLLYIIFFRDLWNFTEFICRRVIKEKIYKLSTGNNKSSMDLITLYFYLLGPLRGPVQKKGTPRTGASFLWDFVDDFGIPYSVSRSLSRPFRSYSNWMRFFNTNWLYLYFGGKQKRKYWNKRSFINVQQNHFVSLTQPKVNVKTRKFSIKNLLYTSVLDKDICW